MLTLSTGLRNGLLETSTNSGAGWSDLFANCVIRVFDGTKPADADTTEGSANVIVTITLSGGTFTPGNATNGLNFGQVSGGVAQQATGETWEGTVTFEGSPTWFRVYDNDMVTGDSSTEVRADGTIGLAGSGADMEVDASLFGSGKVVQVTGVSLTIPA